MLADISEPKS